VRPPAEGVPARVEEFLAQLPPADDDCPTIISLNRQRNGDDSGSVQGRQLGHFELIEPIGVGGMAAVIRAKDLELGRIVALKILPPEMAADPENIVRFKQEARAAAKLDHENIARVFFCGEDQGLHFIAFEYVEGMDLRSRYQKQGRLTPVEAVDFMLQVAGGLAHSSARGVVHRDIKPSNIIVTPEGQAKIVDMGLARQTDAVHGGVTHSGMTLGTFDYVAPEQAIEPRAADIRCDIYALGCTFYHLLTGQPPVPEGTAAKKLHHHQHVAPVDPRELNPDIPVELVAILGRMMAKDPADRFPTPEALIETLTPLAATMKLKPSGIVVASSSLSPPPKASPLLIGGLAMAAVVVVVALLSLLGGPPAPYGSSPPGWVASPISEKKPNQADRNESTPNPEPIPLPAPQMAGGERIATTPAELMAAIKDGVTTIHLNAREFDLRGVADLSLRAKRLTLIGSPEPAERPWIRLERPIAFAGSGTGAELELKHLRLTAGPEHMALVAEHVAQVRLSDCEFAPGTTTAGGVEVGGPEGGQARLILENCVFTQGSIAVALADRARLEARECAFGPHATVVRVRANAVRPASDPTDSPAVVTFDQCSVMMADGTVFQFDRAGGKIRAGGSLFAVAPDAKTADPLLVRPDPNRPVRFEGVKPRPNAFFRMSLWSDGERRYARLNDCREANVPFLDNAARELTESPWSDRAPLARLANDDLAAAFASRYAIGPSWSASNRPLPSTTHDGPAVRYVDRGIPESDTLPAGTYRTLEAALADVRPGDEIRLRHNGEMAINPIDLSHPRQERITIRPDGPQYRPVLTLSDATNKADANLFTVYNGSLAFEDIHFRLRAQRATSIRENQSVVAIVGGGIVSFTRCAATLEELEDSEQIRLALVSLGNPHESMRNLPMENTSPRVRLKNCFVRGKGDLLAVRPSRAFDLDLDGSLLVLAGSLLTVEGNVKEAVGDSRISLRRVTTYLSEPSLDMHAADVEKKIIGLGSVQFKSEDSMFVASGEGTFLRGTGFDGDMPLRNVLAWDGSRNNIYGNFKQLLEVAPTGAIMMPAMTISKNDWRSREPDARFEAVRFEPAAGRSFIAMRPGDFQTPRLLDVSTTDADVTARGAPVKSLPDPDESPPPAPPTAPSPE
jgi:serine/threonine protein kinase